MEKTIKKYNLRNNKQCDAKKYGLYSGRDFDNFFLETYLPNYETSLFEGEGE